MPSYSIRPATLDDVDVLVHHRIGMFAEMGTVIDVDAVALAFQRWLWEMMPAGTYRAWLVQAHSEKAERGDGAPAQPHRGIGAPGVSIVGGGGITILPWPPGPQTLGARIAFAYNVYTEPSHRHRGLARAIMGAIHDWCRANGIGAVLLNASQAGEPLYESIGYRPTPSPMMFLALGGGSTL